MSSAQEFNVHLIGIPGQDKQMLQRVIKLRGDSGIARSYSITDDSDPAPGKLYVVNSDNDDSRQPADRLWSSSSEPFPPSSERHRQPPAWAG